MICGTASSAPRSFSRWRGDSSLGGFLTPLGGAPNLLAMKLVQDTVTHHEFLFTTWVTRLAPLTVAVVFATLIYVVAVFQSEMAESDRPREVLSSGAPGPGADGRRRTLGAPAVRGGHRSRVHARTVRDLAAGIHAGVRVSGDGLAAFAVRAKREPLLTWEFAQGKMMWGLFYVFAGGNALGAVLNATGAARFLAQPLVPYAAHGQLVATLVFGALTMAVAQIISNVATVAIMVPIAVSVFAGTGGNPIPYIYVIIAASHCGFMLPSSAGSSALAAGYGVNLRTMFTAGFGAALVCLAVIVVVSVLSMWFWPGFSAACTEYRTQLRLAVDTLTDEGCGGARTSSRTASATCCST